MKILSVTIEIKAIELYFPDTAYLMFIVLEWKNLCLIKFSTLVENFRKYCVIRLARVALSVSHKNMDMMD